MKKRIFRYLKHLSLTFVALLLVAVIIGLSIGASVHYGDHPAQYSMVKEGPYVFYEDDSTFSVNYVAGSRAEGYILDQKTFLSSSVVEASCFFTLDSSKFNFNISGAQLFDIPQVTYNDDQPILAISDIESGYKAFRDFLINSNVIDNELNWTFGQGHLVLVGDFVDRGNSTTQVLWFIYKLEQDAKTHGGQVHYILGNHELKNLQGNYKSASEKYFRVASVLKRQPQELYSSKAMLGKWLLSKNPIESINGNLFVHGGLDPNLSETGLSLGEMAEIIRSHYANIYYPMPIEDIKQQLISTKTGPCWYRGYFKEDLSQAEIDRLLIRFDANAVVVGHTIQSKVNRVFDGKVIAIDVKHPKDYHKNWPAGKSEGLLIDMGKYYRVFATGEKEII